MEFVFLSSPWGQRAVLILFVLAAYGLRMSEPSIRGEESRWATCAMEMVSTGDWVVPRQQGEPFLSRPPLRMWPTAMLTVLRGRCDEVAIRLPSVVAMVLTTLMIHHVARGWMSGIGAFAGAIGFASMVHVLELGRLGETDSIYVLFVAGSLLLWRDALRRGRPMWQVWSIGYGLAALALLTKGPQGPAYFVGGVGLFILVTRRWRLLFCMGHLVGVVVFLAVAAAWHVPFAAELGWPEVVTIHLYEFRMHVRFNLTKFLINLPVLPVRLFANTLPWSMFLPLLFSRAVRTQLGAAREEVVFLVCCLAAAFPTVWLVQGAPRYMLSLYPCIALLAGLVIDRCLASDAPEQLRAAWRRLVIVIALVAAIGGIAVVVMALLPGDSMLWQPLPFAVFCAAGGIVIAVVLWRGARSTREQVRMMALVLTAGVFAVGYAGVYINVLNNRTTDIAAQVAAMRVRIGAESALVSAGVVHHRFAYEYGWPIPRRHSVRALESGDRWACLTRGEHSAPRDPGEEWELIAVVSCDRYRAEQPRDSVAIYRRRDR